MEQPLFLSTPANSKEKHTPVSPLLSPSFLIIKCVVVFHAPSNSVTLAVCPTI